MVGSRRVFVLFLILGRRADHPMIFHIFPYLFYHRFLVSNCSKFCVKRMGSTVANRVLSNSRHNFLCILFKQAKKIVPVLVKTEKKKKQICPRRSLHAAAAAPVAVGRTCMQVNRCQGEKSSCSVPPNRLFLVCDACKTRVQRTNVRTTPVQSQQCKCQLCERENSANKTRARMSNVRMLAVRCDIGAKKVRQQWECQQCETPFLSFWSKHFLWQKEFFSQNYWYWFRIWKERKKKESRRKECSRWRLSQSNWPFFNFSFLLI